VSKLPTVFVDRSLGRVQVPALLRTAGVALVTLAEHYGVPADEQVSDVTWIAESAQRGWIAFMKDFAIRRRPAEIEAILEHGARALAGPLDVPYELGKAVAGSGVDAAISLRMEVDHGPCIRSRSSTGISWSSRSTSTEPVVSDK
jgi:hypothetical protein